MNETVVKHQEKASTRYIFLKPLCLILISTRIKYIIKTLPRCTLLLSTFISVEVMRFSCGEFNQDTNIET